MSVDLLRQSTDLQYTGFYLPLVTAVYLHNIGVQGFNLFGFQIPPLQGPLFQLTVFVTFFGGVVNHGMFRSIYGRGGPRENPKDKWTVKYQRIALLFWKQPRIRPSSLSELGERFEKGIEKATSTRFTTLRIGVRVVSLAGIQFTYTLAGLSLFALLFLTIWTESIDYLGFGLLFAQAMFIIAPKIWKRFPSVVPEHSAEWLFVPEHRRGPTLFDDDKIEFYRDPRGIFAEIADMSEADAEQNEGASEVNDTEKEYLVALAEEEPNNDS